MIYIVSFLIGFFSGAIPYGYIVSKIKGIDIRREGSGNIGFSNVFRTVGKPEGIIVLVLDFAKGLLPVLFVTNYCGYNYGLIAGVASMLGHMFTPFLKLKGGKGVATGLGVFIGLAPLSAVFAFVVWLIVVAVTRYISLGSIVAAFALPVLILCSRFFIRDEFNIYLEMLTIVVCVLVILLHRENIKRLFAGKERKFSFGKREE